MKLASVQKDGKIRTIIYRDKDYFYEDGTRVPDNVRKGFHTTIFKTPPNQRRPIIQAELDAFVKGVRERARQGLLKKPEPTQQPESSND
jgi:predicted DNA-binding protein (UPF0278 family)